MAKDGFLARITEWAERQPDIRTIVLTGSRARDDGSVDETSDYDVEVFTTDRAKYETHAGWMEEIGDVWVYLPETRADDRYLMRLVVFEGGMKLDFALAPTTVLEEMVTEQKLNSLCERGYAAFGRFNAGDAWPTLLATASLFRDLAIETSEKLGHRYPHDVDRSISGYLRKFEGRF